MKKIKKNLTSHAFSSYSFMERHFLTQLFVKRGTMIRTSLHLSKKAHQKLKEAAVKQQKEIEDIIIALARFVAVKRRNETVKMRAVKYQDSHDKEHWDCVRVRWEGDEYEFLIDLRKVHKVSVSKLINDAIMQYICDDGSYIEHIVDNYFHHGYFSSKINERNLIKCSFIWVFPRDLMFD